MPLFAPRSETIKKQEQLQKRKLELQHAVQSKFALHKLYKSAEKYRAAQLSLLKAKIHVLKEKEIQNKLTDVKYSLIETEIKRWSDMTEQEIIIEFTKTHGTT